MFKLVNPLIDKIILVYAIITAATVLLTANYMLPLIIYGIITILSVGVIVVINIKKWPKKELLYSCLSMLGVIAITLYYIID